MMAGALAPFAATAHETKAKALEIVHPWVRAIPKGADVTAGYVTIRNKGKKPDTLVGATLEGSALAEMHTTTIENGVASMRLVKEGIVIAPGAEVKLEPSSTHIMFMKLSKTPSEDTYVVGTLEFERAGTIKVEYFVEAPGKIPDIAAGHHDGHGSGTGPATAPAHQH